MSTIPPISSFASAPVMILSSPAALMPSIQSRTSLLAIARPHACATYTAKQSNSSHRSARFATRLFSRDSAAGHRIFDQVVDMIEGNFSDRFLHLENPRRYILLHRHDRCFNWRTLLLHAGYFLDDDRDLFREVEVLPHPVANLFERIGRDFDVAPKRVGIGRRVA